MTKEYLKETAKEFIDRYPERLNKFMNEFEADENDYIKREIEYFENTLYDIENSNTSNDGFSTTGVKNFSIASDLCEEICFEKFKYSTEKKIKFLKGKIALLLEQPPTQPKAKPQLGGYTNAQLVLIFYYFFKQNGLEPRVSIDISPIAKFIHLITGKEFKAVTSSDFYKKLQTVPNFKTDKELINDLEAIKPLFKMVQLNEVVKMIENEIDLARNEMKQAKKK